MQIIANSASVEFEIIKFQCFPNDVFHSVALPIFESMFITDVLT